MTIKRLATGLAASGILLTTLLSGPPCWAAEKRAVFLTFTGPGASGVQKTLQQAVDLDLRVALVPSQELFNMAGEVGVDRSRLELDPTLLSQAATAAQIDAVVRGTIDPRATQVELVVVDGGTGQELRRLSIPLARGRLDGAEHQRTVQRLIAAIEGGQWMGPLPPEVPKLPAGDGDEPTGHSSGRIAQRSPGSDDDHADDDHPGDEPLPATRRERRVEPAPLVPTRTEDEFTEPLFREPRTTERAPRRRGPAPEEEPTGRRSGPAPVYDRQGFSVFVGFTAVSRGFELSPVRLANGDKDGRLSYSSGIFPALSAEAGVYPMVLLGQRGWLSGLGVEADYEMAVSLKSKIGEQIDPNSAKVTSDRLDNTTQYQFGGALAYRLFPFSLGAGEAMFKLRAGLAMHAFGLETGTFTYKSNRTSGLKLGLGFELPFISSGPVTLALEGQGEGLIGSTVLREKAADSDQEETRYPTSPARGFDIKGYLRVTYASALIFRVGYWYQQIGSEFARSGEEPAASGKDSYQGLLLLLGYGG